jgi:hypothetical protein
VKDINGRVMQIGDTVAYAIANGRSSATLRIGIIESFNQVTKRVKVELQGPLSEYERRVVSTPHREDKFCVIDSITV